LAGQACDSNTGSGGLERKETDMRRGLTVSIIGLLLLTGHACRRAADEAPLPADPVASPIQIEVQNNHALPVEVFITGAGVNHRLGTVHPGMSASFRVPPGMIGNGSVELLAQSSAVRQPNRTGPILLSPGAIVDYVIAAQLFNSTATIR
jgi:hypothetical protein